MSDTSTKSEKHCYTCDGSKKAARGWGGQPSNDGVTCPDCNGTGVDASPYGTGADHCPWCGSDWKRPHDPGCRCAQ